MSRIHCNPHHSGARHSALLAVLSGFLGTLLSLPVNAAIAIPDTPLQSGSAVPPNIMFILDDSGSMGWDFMPDSVPATTPVNIAAQAYTRNGVFYNPNVRYLPWSDQDGNVCVPPFTSVACSVFPDRVATNAFTDNNRVNVGTTNLTGSTRVFHVPNAGITNLADARQYTRYELTSGGTSARACTLNPSNAWVCSNITSFPWGAPLRSDCAGANCTIAEEWHNYALWYSYHRTRMKAAKAGAGAAFAALSRDLRVGFDTIWQRGTLLIPVTSNDGLFENTGSSTNRETWFGRLYNAAGSGGTPLRKALRLTGEYYQRTDASGPWGPEAGSNQLACRQAFTILTTDGFWNGPNQGLGNEDGTNGPTITGPNGASFTYTAAPPFSDSWSDTLADMAMKFWKNDLRPDLPNIVPSSGGDPAFWQHMTTFTIGLGLNGTLNPDTDLPRIQAGDVAWPKPSANNIANLDDLWHAAVNGHGTFVVASDPKKFSDGLRNALAAIVERIGSSSNVATNSVSVGTDTRLFQATFIAGQWTGDLFAFRITNSGINNTPIWSASQGIPTPFTARRLFTEKAGSGVTLDWGSLDAARQAKLNAVNLPSVNNGPAILDYLRGSSVGERRNGGAFRNRNNLLGDIVNSSPAFVKDNNTIFVGANDGMLHAFDAADGREVFAFVPEGIDWTQLASLADPEYVHRWFVDGPVAVSTRAQTGGRNILIGALGRGGKGVFALDVTTPSGFSGGDFEWSAYSDPDMGFVMGRPIIAKLNNGDLGVIVSNGINSDNERPALFVYKLTTGALLKKISTGVVAPGSGNGLSAPRAWDSDGNGTIDLVFAGDLKGNVWKFDLSGNSPSTWKVAGSPANPIFTAKDASGNPQPITAAPSIGLDPNTIARWVFVATGRLLSSGDLANKDVQSLYGLVDSGTISGRGELQKREILSLGAVAGRTVRGFEPAGQLPDGKKGWYLDFVKPPGAVREGERIVSDLALLGPVLLSASAIPSDDPCEPGGRGFLNAIDAFSGTSVRNAFFDVNANGMTSDDMITGPSGAVPIGSSDMGGIGMVTSPSFLSMSGGPPGCVGVVVAGGSTGALGSDCASMPGLFGRISWREVIQE